jgi:hypothetical protein
MSPEEWLESAVLADALGGMLGLALAAIESREAVERERDQALAVLDLAGTPFAVTDPLATEVRLNDAARQLLADVVDAEQRLHRLLARPGTTSGWSRRIDVELVTGETGTIHGHLRPVDDVDGAPSRCSSSSVSGRGSRSPRSQP